MVIRLHSNSHFGLDVPNEAGVYVIFHEPTLRIYVGSSGNLRRRFTQHMHCLRNGIHYSEELQRLYDQDGMVKIIIAELSPDRETALKREQVILSSYIPDGLLLNKGLVVDKPTLGRKVSEESKNKFRASRVGKKLSEDVKRRNADRLRSKILAGKDPYIRCYKRCMFNGVVYKNIAEASRVTGIPITTLRRKVVLL